MNEEQEMTIQVDLNEIKEYINNEDFISYISATSNINIALFIYHILNKTIKYMMEDNNG